MHLLAGKWTISLAHLPPSFGDPDTFTQSCYTQTGRSADDGTDGQTTLHILHFYNNRRHLPSVTPSKNETELIRLTSTTSS